MKENTNEQKRKFNAMLLSTNREGMANVIDKQEEQGFFMAPASTKFHLNYEGELLPFQSPEMKDNLNAPRDRSPLLDLIQAADGLAANLIER